MQVFSMQDTMQEVNFKTDTSEPAWVVCTPDGRIDYSELGLKFGLEPTSIDLSGVRFTKTGLKSDGKWEQIEELFKRRGYHVGTEDDPVLVTAAAPVRTVSTVDSASRIRRAIIEQPVRLCKVDELPGLLRTELKGDLRFPVVSGVWNTLPTNRDKLCKLAGPAEECYNIMSLVNIIVTPPMPSPTADTEDSFHHFWDTVIEEPLKYFYDGLWLAERNKSGEGSTSGTRPDKVVRFGFRFYALWRGEEKGPATAGDPRVQLISKLNWTYKHLPFLMAYYICSGLPSDVLCATGGCGCISRTHGDVP